MTEAQCGGCALAGRVAVVTGAGGANGIGQAIALRLADEGARVAVLDIDGAGAESVAAEIAARGGAALGTACDVADLEQCERAARRVASEWGGRIDILVNNAAAIKGMVWRPFDEYSVEEWDRMLAVNLRGQWCCARAVVPFMKAHGYGKIVNVTSSSFFEGVAGMIHYVSSKGGVVGFTRALGRELGEFGIRVNAIAPGYTLTGAQREHAAVAPEWEETQRRAQALTARNLVPEDMTGPALFLASQDSDMITCQTILVDGGRNMW